MEERTNIRTREITEMLEGLSPDELRRLAFRGVTRLSSDFLMAFRNVRDIYPLWRRLESGESIFGYDKELVRRNLVGSIDYYLEIKGELQMCDLWTPPYDRLESQIADALKFKS